MFMHGGWLHLIGNMWFLALFGRNVECALDHGRFLVFYILCGLVGGLIYTFTDPNSVIPCLGRAAPSRASWAPTWRFIHSTWSRFGWLVRRRHSSAGDRVVGIWFLFQYVAAFASLESAAQNMGGVAYWDHLGGFATGVAFVRGTILYLRLKQANQPPEEETAQTADALEAMDQPKAADPFANFLPLLPRRGFPIQPRGPAFARQLSGLKSVLPGLPKSHRLTAHRQVYFLQQFFDALTP